MSLSPGDATCTVQESMKYVQSIQSCVGVLEGSALWQTLQGTSCQPRYSNLQDRCSAQSLIGALVVQVIPGFMFLGGEANAQDFATLEVFCTFSH